MSTIKANNLTNGAGEVNFASNVAVGDGYILKEYAAQGGAPDVESNGAVWWDTTTSTYNIYINGAWAKITLA